MPAAAPEPVAAPPNRTVMTAPPASYTVREPDSRARSLRLIVAALVAVLLVGGGGIWLLRRSQSPTGSVAGVPAPGQGHLPGVGAPQPAGPGVVGAPGQGTPGGVPGPSVTGQPADTGSAGPGVVRTPAGSGGPGVVQTPGGPGGPGVAAAPGGPQGGPPVTAAPQQPQAGPSVVRAPEQAKPGPGVTTTPPTATSGPAVTTAPADPKSGPPVTERPSAPRQADTQPRMSVQVRNYLEFLRRVEAERKRYDADQINGMVRLFQHLMATLLDENNEQPPDRKLVAAYSTMAQQYAVGLRRFHTTATRVGIPPECRPLHQMYSRALLANANTILDTARRINVGDVGGLQMMRPRIGADVNAEYLAADDELGRICEYYRVRKSFDLGNGRSGGSLFSF